MGHTVTKAVDLGDAAKAFVAHVCMRENSNSVRGHELMVHTVIKAVDLGDAAKAVAAHVCMRVCNVRNSSRARGCMSSWDITQLKQLRLMSAM